MRWDCRVRRVRRPFRRSETVVLRMCFLRKGSSFNRGNSMSLRSTSVHILFNAATCRHRRQTLQIISTAVASDWTNYSYRKFLPIAGFWTFAEFQQPSSTESDGRSIRVSRNITTYSLCAEVLRFEDLLDSMRSYLVCYFRPTLQTSDPMAIGLCGYQNWN